MRNRYCAIPGLLGRRCGFNTLSDGRGSAESTAGRRPPRFSSPTGSDASVGLLVELCRDRPEVPRPGWSWRPLTAAEWGPGGQVACLPVVDELEGEAFVVLLEEGDGLLELI